MELYEYIRTAAEKDSKMADEAVIPAVLEGPEDWCGIHQRIQWNYVTKPAVLMDEPHSHDFEEFLIFLGNKPGEPEVFGAEIEISLGEEGETHTVTTNSVVPIPKGLVHGPVEVKSIDTPLIFAVIYLSTDYVRKPAVVAKTTSTANKYGNYILENPQSEPRPLETEKWGVQFVEKTTEGVGKFGCNFHVISILGTHMLPDPPHDHECDEFLYFIPASYENWPDLGGEVQLGLGDKWEKQTITKASIVCIPAGLSHCPVYMKTVNTPFYWGHMLPTASYESSEYNKEAAL